MKNIIISILIIGFLSGCTSTYRHNDLQMPLSKLDPSRGVAISISEDGWYEHKQYKNSGRMTANTILSAFSKYANKVDIINSCTEDSCLDEIDSKKYGYYVKPIILNWEDRATEWSGKPDRVEIQMVVFDLNTKEVLANFSFTGKSKWATWGGDHPQDLLPEPTRRYVSSLYR